MPLRYDNLELLHTEDFQHFDHWHHEGIGTIERGPEGGMRLHCEGSRQGGPGCMAFFRPDLPDQIAVEYEVVIRSHGGLMINYLAIRGLQGEDLIADADRLPPRTGVMADYFAARRGLQSYHVSVSRFNDRGEHTETSNWRRNPGGLLVGHGVDPCCAIGVPYRLRLTKDRGSLQLFVDGRFAHGCVDHAAAAPDSGKFGFRLIGSDVAVDVRAFRVYRVAARPELWQAWD